MTKKAQTESATGSTARDQWIRQKRGELESMAPICEEVSEDRAAGNLPEEERDMLIREAQRKGRDLTDAEATWLLASYRAWKHLAE